MKQKWHPSPHEAGKQAMERFIDAHKSGRRDLAGVHAMTALESFSKIADKQRRREELRPLAVLFQRGGVEDLALVVLSRLVVIEQALENHQGVTSALLDIGNIYTGMENYDDARSYAERALDVALENGNFADAASASTNVASVFARRGDYESALPRLRRSLELLRKAENPHSEFITRALLIELLDKVGSNTDEAFAVARPLFGRLSSFAVQIQSQLVEMLERIADRHPAVSDHTDLIEWKAKALPELWGAS